MRSPREIDAPERRAAHRRRARWGRFRRWGLGAAALGLPFAVLPADQADAQALPTGGNVVGGSGTISQTSANQLTINQNSSTLSIDWQSFSVGAGNIVRFIQPDSSALALNRVIGPDPSMIFGSIQANGRVVIMNPAGIYFGPSAMVDVNGLVATTSRMSQADFLAGNLNFSIAGDVNARVINEGFVNVAQGGFAVLSAAAVENKGTIVAQGGTVVLAGTPTFTLDFFGDGLLKFASTGTVNQAPTGANALVENSGTVQANGGRVLMTARAARDVINNVINVTGIVEARSARVENGEIVIDGGEFGNTVVASRLDVSGNEADAKGGTVTVLGGNVQLAAGTDIRASGEAGGGTVLVGGGQRGQGTAYNAQTLYMDAAAVIDANATLNGNGGKVVLWADDTARVEGSITARGGTIAGDGGFVETSGKNRISFADTVAVDTRAFNGRDGSLLIDPNDFTIASSGGDITAAVLLGMLTTSDITIDSATGASGTLGNINVNDAIVYTGVSTRTLTLNAQGSININAGISASILNINLVLQADGNVNIAAAINTNNGYITTAGYNGVGALGGNFTTTAAISLSNAALTLNTAGAIALNGTVTTTGTVTLNAGGATTQTYAITGGAGLVLGGTGAITLNESGNNFAHITLNRAGTTTNVSLVTSATPIVHASALGTGSFSLSGLGFVQTGSIIQDALADSFTINGGLGNVTLSQANTFTGDVTLLAGTISVTNDQSFDIDSSAVLNLLSNGDISISRNLVATGPGSMSMIFNARYSGGSFGSINIRPTTYDISIDTNGGYIVMGGGSGGLTNALPSAAQAAIGGGIIDQGISIRGYDSAGTPLGVTINTGGGNFFARGTGAAGGTAPAGVALNSTAGGGWVTIETGAGNINIHGTGGTGSNGDGVLLQGDSAINAATLQTTSGNITITGISGTGGDSNGINAGDYSEISTTSGTLTLTGTSTGTGFSRGVLATGMIDAGSASGSAITGTSLNEYGVRLGPTTDWRVGSSGILSVMGTGASGIGIDGSSFTLNNASLVFSGEGTSGQGINISNTITYDGVGGELQFLSVGAYADIVVADNALIEAATGSSRSLVFDSFGDIRINATGSAGTLAIGAATGGILNVDIAATGSVTLGGRVVTEGGTISIGAGTKVTINAGIETFGGDITVWGNAPGGTPSGTPSSGVNIGVNLQRTSATAVTLDAGGGNISIAGAGGDGGNYSHGVLIDGVVVQTSGAGSIDIVGKAGASASGAGQVGVFINGDISLSTAYSTGTALVSGTGGITLTGYGGASGSGGTNIGVRIARAALTATDGSITVTGTGGAGSNSHSIEIAGADILSTGSSNQILLWGEAPIGTGTGISLRDSYDGASTSVTIGGASFQGNLGFVANSLTSSASTLSLSRQAGAGLISFETANPALGIGINGGDPAGGMAITSGILESISGYDTVIFGGAGMTASIQVDNTQFFNLVPGAANFVFHTDGVFLSNTMEFSGQAVTLNTGGTTTGTILGATTLTLSGGGDVTATVVANAIAVDKGGTSANVTLTSPGMMTLAASSMGSGVLDLTAATGIAQTGALIMDIAGGDVSMTSSGAIILSQANVFTGSMVTIEGASIQITAHQDFTRNGSQTVNLTSTAGNVLVGGDLVKLSGMGGADFHIDAAETAWFANAGIQSDGGSITIWGNAPGGDNNAGTNAGTAWGVQINGAGAILSAGAGLIDIVGKGSTDSGAGQHGIVLINGGRIETTSGGIILSGRGGDGTGVGAQGIILTGGSQIESQSGYIELYGRGGANSANAHGISLDSGASIVNIGATYVLLNGTGELGGKGVIALGASSIAAGASTITLISNNGIEMDGTVLTAAGGANFDGGAGNAALNNAGNDIAGSIGFTTLVGDVSFNSAGAVTIGATTVNGNLAVASLAAIGQSAPIQVTGASSFTAAAAITLTNAGNMFGGAVAIYSQGNSSIATSGALTLDTAQTQGFSFTADAGDGLIVAGGIASLGGDINLYGNAPGGTFGSSSVANFGVSIDSASALVDAGGGNIVIKGAGGTAGSHGVTIRNGAGVQTMGSGSITITGQGGNGGPGSAGVEFYAGAAYAQTQHGDLTVTGTGGTSGYGNTGVALATGEIRSVGGGNVTVTGTGGGLASVGVHVGGGGATTITAVDGNLTINAIGGGANDSGYQSWGLEVGVSQIGGIGTTGAGNISITATAGGVSGDGNRYGVIVGNGGVVQAQAANISIQSAGGTGTGANNHAVYLDSGTINSAGTLTLNATSGGIAGQTGAVTVLGNTTLSTANGNIDWAQLGGMTMGSITSTGTLNVSVTGGSISQVGTATVTGTSSFTADGNIALTNASNAFGGALSLTAISGSASVTNSGALILGDVTVGGALTVTAGGALTQLGASFFSAGSTSLSATGTMMLTESGNAFGTSLSLTGTGGALDGTASAVTASSGSFTFNGAPVANSAPSSPGTNVGETTNTVTTETLAQIITQILTSTVTQPSSSTTSTDATTVNPVSPAAVQAMLIAILAEAASPAGGTGGNQQGGGETGNNNVQQSGGQTGGAPGTTPSPAAGTGTFAAGTQITINTSGGTVQSITVTPVGGGAPVTILPGLLNLAPPAIPTATASGTPGISGNFPLAWGGR
jgi:filamentous hemagglutinin family protein